MGLLTTPAAGATQGLTASPIRWQQAVEKTDCADDVCWDCKKNVLYCLKRIKVYYQIKRLIIKQKKMLLQKEKLTPLKYRFQNQRNAMKFCGDLSNYIESNIDFNEYYERGGWNYVDFTKEINLYCYLNTGQNFEIRYIDTKQTPQGQTMHFRFRLMGRYDKQVGWLDSSTPAMSNEIKYFDTDLNFYVTYIGDSFNVQTNNFTANDVSDFGFILDKIVDRLIIG